ncbi:MAG: (2Fe-2S)-binding protein, partial [Betaproteobacteria bacterium]
MISFQLNGISVSCSAERGQRLSEVLRRDFGQTGTKSGCDAGDCGACTVLIDGELACACLVPVGQAEGASIQSVEGLQAT